MNMNDPIMKNGYIVHRPARNGSIGMLFKGWDASGKNYILGHNNGMIFLDRDIAQEMAEALGDDWKLKRLSELTSDDFARMNAMTAIFD